MIVPPERWDEVEALFKEALDVVPERRPSFLDSRTRDPEVRRDVDRLLRAHALSDRFMTALDPLRVGALLAATATDLEPGDRVGPYEVAGRIGAGGMGVVYRAHDPRLDRAVALKLLRSHAWSDSRARRRLAREARTASALDHPNVGTIYDIGETEAGGLYVAMACYEGETVRDLIARGPMSVADALDLTTQVAEGLRAAHARGIVHRDVKPGNLIRTAEGVVKIVDFGIATMVGGAGAGRGSAAGTVAYMSPEQADGGAVDARTDLWSLAVVLYEALSGARPFPGEDSEAVLAAIRSEPHPPLASARPDLPASLCRIVDRCLSKDPDDRFDDAGALLEALERVEAPRSAGRFRGPGGRTRWSAAVAIAATIAVFFLVTDEPSGAPGSVAGSRPTSIAVVPFVPTAPDSALARLGRDLAVTLGASLDATDGLRTVEPTTVLAQPEVVTASFSVPDVSEMARRMAATHVVHGTLVRSGDRIRVEGSLVDLSSSESRGRIAAEAAPDEIAVLTDSLALDVLRRVGTAPEIQAPNLEAITTSSVEAMRAYLAGERAIAQGRFRAAPEHFARATRADSTFWFAYWRYLYARSYHGEPVDSAITAKVVEHRDELPEPDRRLIEARMASSQRERLERRRDITRLFPSYWPAWFELGDQLTHHGPYLGVPGSETRDALERVVALNPHFVPAHEHLLWGRVRVRDTVATGRILETLEAVRLDTLKVSEWNLGTLDFYRCLDALARSDGIPSPECLDIGVETLVEYRGPLDPERIALGFTTNGFPRAAIALADGITAEDRASPEVKAAHVWSRAVASAARGDWGNAVAEAERYARLGSHPYAPEWSYGLAVAGAWIGSVSDGDAADLRPRREPVPPDRESAAEVAWLDGVRAFARADGEALRRAQDEVERSGAGAAPVLSESLVRFEQALDGRTETAARGLARLERMMADEAWHYRHGQRHPFVNSVHRLSAARWLLAAGDTTEAARLLVWHEADFPGSLHPLQAVNVALGAPALYESARLEDARGRPEVARSYYERFLQQYDRAPPVHQEVVEAARAAVTPRDPAGLAP